MNKNALSFVSGMMALMSALLIGLDGCSPGKTAKGLPSVPVLVATAIETNVTIQIQPEPVGHVMPYSTVAVRSQITGTLDQIHFQEGQEVKAGELLFTMDPRPSQATLTAAQANLARDQAQLENAKIQYAREQKLFEQKLVSQEEFDTSRAGMEALTGTIAADTAAITNAQLSLAYCEIRAPFDGRTGSVQFHAGNVVKAQDDTLLTINRIHPIYVTFAVAERHLPEIVTQMRGGKLAVQAVFEGMVDAPPQGELTFVDNAVDATTGTIQLKATFPNDNGVLWPGQFVRVALNLSKLTNAVVVPSQAVQTSQNGEFIYIVKTDQTVEARPVKTGFTSENQTVVETGLHAGEIVVTDGQLRLKPGTAVNMSKSSAVTNAPKVP